MSNHYFHGLLCRLESEEASISEVPDEDLLPSNYDFYRNSIIHAAIIYNMTNTARALVKLAAVKMPIALGYTDNFSGSKSTVLVLAAKLGNTRIAIEILKTEAGKLYINNGDYRNNTPLHYACLMRNNPLILDLLEGGADPSAPNIFGDTPYDCYHSHLCMEDLTYRYGTTRFGEAGLLKKSLGCCNDFGGDYIGTLNGVYSNYRWFLPHIVKNMCGNEMPKWLTKHISGLTPSKAVYYLEAYAKLIQLFVTYHNNAFSPEVAARLKPKTAIVFRLADHTIFEHYEQTTPTLTAGVPHDCTTHPAQMDGCPHAP